MTCDLPLEASLPSLYHQVLARITSSVDATTLNVLRLAAILGHRLNDMKLYALVDLTTGQTMSGMAALVGRKILRDTGGGVEFSNELVRAAAYVGVPSPLRRVLHSSVADIFIQEAGRGKKSLGLEIAWHCTRAGRTHEATPYLLSGAREALDQGALDSAERALSSALPQLPEDDRDQTVLLLVEVLQEQGRWAESASLLSEANVVTRSELAAVFALLAEHRTGGSSSEHLTSGIRRLLAYVESSAAPALRVRAALAAARLLPDLRDESLAAELVRAVEAIPTTELSEQEIVLLAASKAQLLYHANRPQASLRELLDLIRRLEKSGAVNTTLANLYIGLGAIRCFEGKYAEAKEDFGKALAIFARIGNETIQGNIAAQIALCCGRLGNYGEQILWSRRADERLGLVFTGYNHVQATYYNSFGLAMRGEVKEALQAMNRADSRISRDAAEWLIQAWRLARADILFMCGQSAAALAVAQQATHFPRPVLHAKSFAGSFARWLALIGVAGPESTVAGDSIDQLYNSLERYDTLDRLEILCARAMLAQDTAELMRMKTSIEEEFAGLPAAVGDQLRRLGIIQASTTLSAYAKDRLPAS
jgi:tetratricopeptide (TPR) repeat protein